MQRNAAIPRIETVDELEAEVITLDTDIHTAVKRSTTETVETFLQDYVEELFHATKRLIRACQTAGRRAMRVRATLDKHFQKRWKMHTEWLNYKQDRNVWKAQKILRKNRKTIPSNHGEKRIARSNNEKAEALSAAAAWSCNAAKTSKAKTKITRKRSSVEFEG
ncbi:hypothetical protein NQ315_012757 [Exocentrus adspersus]|uniref:Uncharacterized protein n=1 Tax=Exocentrus adspersus TaxID=1586481 RepID=A0AAV8VD15_9CUCU|nr:hypothetical protein NQ315_012757 [Exocentrus adspersus]